MEIIDLTEQHEKLYCVCLEDWSDEMKEAGDHNEVWYRRMKDKGLRVKLAVDDVGTVGGMIQYAPIEHSMAQGENLYFIYCIWVHGYKQGRGDFRKRGMGKALLAAAEQDAKNPGAKGIAAWGVSIPVFMRASWFKKRGYKKADTRGIMALMWKPFVDDAVPPKWYRQKKRPVKEQGRVVVTAFKNGWCPAQNLSYERAKRAVAELDDKVEFRGIDTFDRDTFMEWGIADALYIDDKEVRTGPPPKYEKIRKAVEKRVRKVRQPDPIPGPSPSYGKGESLEKSSSSSSSSFVLEF